MTVDYIVHKRVLRQLEKQRKINRKKSAFIKELKKMVSEKAWRVALERALEGNTANNGV